MVEIKTKDGVIKINEVEQARISRGIKKTMTEIEEIVNDTECEIDKVVIDTGIKRLSIYCNRKKRTFYKLIATWVNGDDKLGKSRIAPYFNVGEHNLPTVTLLIYKLSKLIKLTSFWYLNENFKRYPLISNKKVKIEWVETQIEEDNEED